MLTNINQLNNTKAFPILKVKKCRYVVAVYARISPKGTGRRRNEEVSIEIQTADMLEEIHNRKGDWRLFQVYSETISGDLAFENRPEAGAKLLEDARLGKFNLVFVWDNDRIGRDREAMAADMFRHEMRKLGVQICSLNQPQLLKEPNEYIDDPYDDGQILQEKLQDWQSASTINKFVKRSIRGKIERAMSGKPLTTPPYGYKLEPLKENGKIVIRKDGRVVYIRVIDEDEKPYVIRVYNEYVLKAKSMNEIRDGLNKDKVPTRKGVHWEVAMIRRILTNEIYYGRLIYGKHFRRKTSISGGSRWGTNTPDKWIIVEPDKTEIKPIISKKLFDKAQEIRNAKHKLGAVSTYNDYLMSGLLRCGICGNKMYSRKFETRYKRKTDGALTKSFSYGYVCGRWTRFRDTAKNYISEGDIKIRLLGDLERYRNNPSVLEGFLTANSIKETNDLSIRIVVINKNLGKVGIRRKRLVILFEHEKITESQFDEADSELDLETQGMEEERNRIALELGDENRKRLGREDFKKAVIDFDAIFSKADKKVQKQFLRSLIESIVIHKRKMEINYSI